MEKMKEILHHFNKNPGETLCKTELNVTDLNIFLNLKNVQMLKFALIWLITVLKTYVSPSLSLLYGLFESSAIGLSKKIHTFYCISVEYLFHSYNLWTSP